MRTTRRTFLGALAAATAVAGSARAEDCAPKAQRVKGPRVWLDLDQSELDDAYDQSVYAPNSRQIGARNASNSELARQRLGPPRRVAYGTSEIEKLDIYLARAANAPINIFIHGGAWLGRTARDFGYPAELFVGAGAITDWKKDHGLPADTVKGYVLSSGMYDLRAPRLSKRGNYVKFTDEMEQELSPQRHLDRINAPIVLLYGSLETPEFKRQTREFAEALKKAGRPVKLVYAEGYNHYEIAETIANPYGFVGREILEQMGLARA